MRRLSFIALMFLCAVGYAQFPMVGSGRQVYRPDQVDSLFYWFDAQDLATITTTNNKVTAWADKGPFGYDVAQADTSKAPTYSATSGPGGSTAALTFDGVDDFLASAAHFWGSDDLTVFAVMKNANATRDAGDPYMSRWGQSTNERQFNFTAGGASLSYKLLFSWSSNGSTGNDLAQGSVKSTLHRIIAWTTQGSNVTTTLHIDGSSQTLTDGVPGNTITSIYNNTQETTIGAVDFNSPTGFLQGSISEIIVFSRALTNAERQGIEAYLSSKYDLALQNKQKPPVISNRRIQPDYVDSLFYWFDASDAATLQDSLGGAIANNEGVGTWNDLSGNGYHVTQTTNGARPVYKATGGPGSKPCIQFDGSNDFLSSAAHFWGSDDYTFIVVAKNANATLNQEETFFGKGEAANTCQLRFSGVGAATYTIRTRNMQSCSVFKRWDGSAKSTAWRLFNITSDGAGTSSHRIDGASITWTGTAISGGNDTIADGSSVFFMGAAEPNGTITNFLQGSISEIIVYSRALTAAERAAIENYLNRKYDLY